MAESLLAGQDLVPSENDHDWLGRGVYFWEAHPKRGLRFVREAAQRSGSSIRKPAVVGAAIELGLCLDLTSSQGIDQVAAYQGLLRLSVAENRPLPANNLDGVRRNLDCAVVNTLHRALEAREETPFDTVKGIFTEGAPIYPGSGFHAKTHVQVCVRSLGCIKGVFRLSAHELGRGLA